MEKKTSYSQLSIFEDVSNYKDKPFSAKQIAYYNRKYLKTQRSTKSRLAKFEKGFQRNTEKKIKLNDASELKIDVKDIDLNESIESELNTAISDEVKSDGKHQEKKITERIKAKKSDDKFEDSDDSKSNTLNRATQTETNLPRILKTFYDENKGDLIFLLQIKGKIIEKPRFDLMKEYPLLVLYFYEMHIEFTDPSENSSITLSKPDILQY